MIAQAKEIHQCAPNLQLVRVDMRSQVLQQVMATIGALPAESGGMLLGPVNSREVTHFHFDDGAICTGTTYTPDHAKLQMLMREKWEPNGLDMKGMVHSHPAGAQKLSTGDLTYVRRLLQANPDMDRFIAPIVLPDHFRVQVFVVLRTHLNSPISAQLKVTQEQINSQWSQS